MTEKKDLKIGDTCWVIDFINTKSHTCHVVQNQGNLFKVESEDGFSGDFEYTQGKFYGAPTFAPDTEIVLCVDMERTIKTIKEYAVKIGFWDEKDIYPLIKDCC
jgi:hypothetical protein